MTTLTRVLLNSASPQAAGDIADAGLMHRRVMSLLPHNIGQNPRAATDTLFRVDWLADQPVLLIQTGGTIDTGLLPDLYGSAATKPVDAAWAVLTQGSVVRYRIAVNPTRRERSSGKTRAVAQRDVPEWWAHRITRHGFADTGEFAVSRPETITGDSSNGNRVLAQRYTISGVAVVTEPDLFRETLRVGIGRSRSYGCGLITVA